MQETRYNPYNPSQAISAPPRNCTPAVTAYTYTPEGVRKKLPPDPASYNTVDDHSIVIRKHEDGFMVSTAFSGSPEDELRAKAPCVGRIHTKCTKFTLCPEGKDGGYYMSINYLPACVQTKNGQSIIYTMRNGKLYGEGPYPAQPRQLTPPTCMDPSLTCLNHSQALMPLSLLNYPIQSSLADQQTRDGQIINAHAINRQTYDGKSTNNQDTDRGVTSGTAVDASKAYDNRPERVVDASKAYNRRPGRRLATHRRN